MWPLFWTFICRFCFAKMCSTEYSLCARCAVCGFHELQHFAKNISHPFPTWEVHEGGEIYRRLYIYIYILKKDNFATAESWDVLLIKSESEFHLSASRLDKQALKATAHRGWEEHLQPMGNLVFKRHNSAQGEKVEGRGSRAGVVV